jgi:Fur family ferric uptake transcriptional regulator
MSCETDTAQALKESGHRPTPQRLLILGALRHAGGHVTAAEILEKVRVSYPYVDISTVYRTLAVLKEMRLVTETDLGGGESQFEWAGGEGHHHLVCRRCGKVTLLDDRHMKALGKGIMASYGFHADLGHFAVFGTCSSCSEERA